LLSVVAGLGYSLGAALNHTPLLSGYVRIEWPWELLLLAVAFWGGRIAVKQALRNLVQVNTLLSDLATGAEPRAVDGHSAEAEYAIEHPLIKQARRSDSRRALDLFYSVGTIYYGVSEPGDDGHKRALDAFADAIVADPLKYGPIVISRLRSIGYTWREDLEKITQRVENKRRWAAGDNGLGCVLQYCK
jgi:hypothetical protein